MPRTPKLISHGAWTQAPDRDGVQWFENEHGRDWYDFNHHDLAGRDTLKLMVRDGIVVMLSLDATTIVPPGEVIEAPADFEVERGWAWKGDHAEPMPEPESTDPVQKLKNFMAANPDVRTLIG